MGVTNWTYVYNDGYSLHFCMTSISKYIMLAMECRLDSHLAGTLYTIPINQMDGDLILI